MKNKMPEINLIISLIVSMSLIFMTYQFTKLKETSEKDYARLSSITYQSLKKLDEKILDEFLLLEKDGLSSDDVERINSKILNK